MIESQKVQVKLLFFATLKDIVGKRELDIDVPSGATVNDLWEHLETRYPALGRYRSIVLTSLNEEYVDREAIVSDGDEVALDARVELTRQKGRRLVCRQADEGIGHRTGTPVDEEEMDLSFGVRAGVGDVDLSVGRLRVARVAGDVAVAGIGYHPGVQNGDAGGAECGGHSAGGRRVAGLDRGRDYLGNNRQTDDGFCGADHVPAWEENYGGVG